MAAAKPRNRRRGVDRLVQLSPDGAGGEGHIVDVDVVVAWVAPDGGDEVGLGVCAAADGVDRGAEAWGRHAEKTDDDRAGDIGGSDVDVGCGGGVDVSPGQREADLIPLQ